MTVALLSPCHRYIPSIHSIRVCALPTSACIGFNSAVTRIRPTRKSACIIRFTAVIGVHHRAAHDRGEKLPVNIFIGGAPSMTVAAVMPLPEGMPELSFAGLLAGQRIPMVQAGGLPFPAQADFVICGHIDPSRTRPEGPFW